MSRFRRNSIAVIFTLVFGGVAVAIGLATWDECRAFGHSVLYCIRGQMR
ncbi:hypothetical protein [Chelatococcus sp.]|nr:hypothetical protein [Chelatococcus sp.]MBX3546898.1 hypothetical protein [Chelatococcus sp.]